MARIRQPAAVAGRRVRYRAGFFARYIDQVLTEACERLGLTAKALGERIEVDEFKLSEYRNARAHPTAPIRQRLAEARQLKASNDEMIARELADKLLYHAEALGAHRGHVRRAAELLKEWAG